MQKRKNGRASFCRVRRFDSADGQRVDIGNRFRRGLFNLQLDVIGIPFRMVKRASDQRPRVLRKLRLGKYLLRAGHMGGRVALRAARAHFHAEKCHSRIPPRDL